LRNQLQPESEYLSEINLKMTEILLQTHGYAPYGSIVADGFFEQETREAISRWQDENGFQSNGILTYEQAQILLYH